MVAKPTGKFERMFAALTRPNLTYRERCVLAIIASHDGAGDAWPSQERIARLLSMTRPAVNAAVQSLAAKRWLKSERRHGNERDVNLYRIAYCEPFEDEPMSENLTVGEGEPMSGSPFIGEGEPMSGLPTLTKDSKSKGATRKETTNTTQAKARPERNGHNQRQKRPRGKTNAKTNTADWILHGLRIRRPVRAASLPDVRFGGEPFICAEHELKSGIIALPFGLSASGLDTPKGRLLFLSEEGQRGLQDAYRVVFGETDNRGIQQ